MTGVFSSDDIAAIDAAVLGFVSREGAVRGVLDFTGVEAMAVSDSRIAVRGQQPSIVAGVVLVAPQPDVNRLCRAFAEHQRAIGIAETDVVTTLDEAYAILGLTDPRFEPVEA
ncbi:MAG: hypothetical protein ACHQK9_14400 [Reyranellales bacterium]